MQQTTIAACVLLALASGTLIYKIFIRLRLSRAKHPSLRGHAKWSRRIARQVAAYSFDSNRFFTSDDAPPAIAQQRRAGLSRLTQAARASSPKSLSCGAALENVISDASFTSAYRVPFPYREQLPHELAQVSIVEESCDVRLRDLDGNWRYDLSGSYGVNVFGYDFYKQCIEQGMALVRELGPVLGAYHPVIRDNVERIARLPGWMKCPSTCPALKRSCRRCGWRATTPAERIWCACAAPTTAGGTAYNPVSATSAKSTMSIPCGISVSAP